MEGTGMVNEQSEVLEHVKNYYENVCTCIDSNLILTVVKQMKTINLQEVMGTLVNFIIFLERHKTFWCKNHLLYF